MKTIKTTFLGATNTKGSRIKISNCDRNNVTLSWDYALDADKNHKAAAKALCDKMGLRGQTVMGRFPDCNVHVFVTRGSF